MVLLEKANVYSGILMETIGILWWFLLGVYCLFVLSKERK